MTTTETTPAVVHADHDESETEHRCACCRLARVRRVGAICRGCDADMTAMHRGRA